MRFLGLRPGGWAWYFQHQFRFSMCYPKGAHSKHHRLGNYPLFGHFGFSFKFSMCYPKGAHWLGHLWLQFPTLGSHLPTSLARDEETIICGALNEKIQITVCLEHHELLYICKFDQFSLLPDQRPRKNHLRSKWHIQWEGWTLCLKHHKLSHVYFWQSLTEWQTCHFLLQVNYSQFVKWSSGFQGRLQNDSILIQETPHVHVKCWSPSF